MSEKDTAPSSPLSEADPTSLDELFLRMDKHITERTMLSAEAERDLDAVVQALRSQRDAWAKAEANGAKRAPKAAKAGQTTLADLGLDDL